MIPIRDRNPSHSFPLVTILIIAANAYIFWLELTAPDIEAFVRRFGLVPAQVDFASPETLTPFLSSMFLHGGWLHIISNMWFLWIFGDNMEASLGKVRYAFFYLFSGLAAGLGQYLIGPESAVPMVGASGAVAGVLGGYILKFPRHRVNTLVPFFGFPTVIALPAAVLLGYWFVIQLLSGLGSLTEGAAVGGVAFFAHVGGFLSGMILAFLFGRAGRH